VVLTHSQFNKAQAAAYERGLWLSFPSLQARRIEPGRIERESICLESNICRGMLSTLAYGLDKRQAPHGGTVSGKSGGERRV